MPVALGESSFDLVGHRELMHAVTLSQPRRQCVGYGEPVFDRRSRRRSVWEPLLPLADALAALGDRGSMGKRTGEIELKNIVGLVAGRDDFDRSFAPRRGTERLERSVELLRAGSSPPPIQCVQVGEMYFVSDGHHRVAASRILGRDEIPARVHRVCTVAYAWSCLRVSDLETVDAQRAFLSEVPLDDDVAKDLWLNDPADWDRLADAAIAWGFRNSATADVFADAHALASAWWSEVVVPTVEQIRIARPDDDLPDLQLFMTALAQRDRLGARARGLRADEPPCTYLGCRKGEAS